MRVRLHWPLADWKSLAQFGVGGNFRGEWLRVGALKGFVDGSLGYSTAKFYEPYLNEPGSTGVFVTPPGKLADLVVLSRDIVAETEKDRLAEAEVLLTVVGGKVVYEKGE